MKNLLAVVVCYAVTTLYGESDLTNITPSYSTTLVVISQQSIWFSYLLSR